MMKQFLPFSLLILYMVNLTHAQNMITGSIKNGAGEPIPYATLVVQGTTIGTVADQDGQFSFSVQKELPIVLAVSSVGYQVQQIQITEWQKEPFQILLSEVVLSELVITSRRRDESSQDVPIPVSVVGGAQIDDGGAFNVGRVKELIPTVQLYSSNPRNTTLNIRGLGSTFGLTNDGIDPGVGFYVDGVYYARPAATSLDFIDVEQIEVLRGPQGTLFGKNTTAGAFNITTRKPSFSPGARFELSYGNYGFVQAKSSITGPLSKKVAGRFSFSGTQRDGLLYNVSTEKSVNDLNNLGARGQLLYTPSDKVYITIAGDANRQRPDGYAQVIAGVVETQRADYRQFEQIIADLGYTLPSRDPFDRLIDHNTTWRSGNDLGGVSLNVDAEIGPGTLTSTSAWRYWNWDPSNDRDFTGLPVLTLSQAPSKHQQWSQEVRYAGDFASRLSGVVGVYVIGQELKSSPYHTEESGSAQWRFSQSTSSPLWQTPGLFEGFGIRTRSELTSLSAALFGQLDWEVLEGLHVLPGIRFNYDQKYLDYDREAYGGLETTDPELIALKNLVYRSQAFTAEVEDNNWSGQVTLAYQANKKINVFATYANSYKPVGVNLGGLPTQDGETMLELAQIKPEFVNHYEFGLKAAPSVRSAINVSVFNTDVRDYQAQVQTPELGVNRGYLANAEKVRVNGVEVDGNIRIKDFLSFYGAVAYTNGKYISFVNAPVPLEEVGGESAFKDISGSDLPGISKWAGSLGGEYSIPAKLFGMGGKFLIAVDASFRSTFSSSSSPSEFLNIEGYALANGRFGFQAADGITILVWGRNLLDHNYFEQLLPAAGSAGHYAGVLGDPRTYGITLRYSM